MNLHQELEQELANIGAGGAAVVAAESSPRHLACDIAERNPLAVSLNQLRLTTTELASADTLKLERIGKALAARLTYLMEPICPIEIDAESWTVQLRSNPPHRDDDGRSYYELLVRRGGEIALTRYRKENCGARFPMPATVTREVLLRLVDDFCAVLE